MNDAAVFHNQDAIGDFEHETEDLLADHDTYIVQLADFLQQPRDVFVPFQVLRLERQDHAVARSNFRASAVAAVAGSAAILAARSWAGAYSAAHYAPVEMVGLYWHFVDLVWIFLFPVLYLL